MSGPALRQLAAHRSIHESAHGQVKEMTRSLRFLYENERSKEGLEAEKVILEHWRDHIIAHADSEEEGLYLEIRKERPELSETITQLMRDHELLRKIVGKIEENLEADESREDRLSMYESLLVVNWHHSRDEEKYLLGEG
ncbi:hemerythrin domain-containing protein [Salinicoccus sp. HZC-1]|uniref:hemerythrin domain-containing protein n=1 Tax=Salinicoccus sp. HZC-1 TaxID=3385497 RepID=UPI00398B35FF